VPPPKLIAGIGEALWDVLPAGRQIGGAPANFAYISSLLGNRGVIASRVGKDNLGQHLRNRLADLGLDTSCLQSDPAHATSTVSIRLDSAGQPRFEIASPVAWDFLEFTPAWSELAAQADVICFGTLAQRSPQSRETIQAFLRAAPADTLRIFDANLREPHMSREIVLESLRHANLVKLNDAELTLVADWLDLPRGDQQASATQLRRAFGLKLVCITRGERGSLLVAEGARDEHPGFHVRVRDAVGAGDAFTAALAHHFVCGSSLARMNRAANRAGAWVASCSGATPPPDPAEIARILDAL